MTGLFSYLFFTTNNTCDARHLQIYSWKFVKLSAMLLTRSWLKKYQSLLILLCMNSIN